MNRKNKNITDYNYNITYNNFKIIDKDSNIYIHDSLDEIDYKQLLHIAQAFAKTRNTVHLLPSYSIPAKVTWPDLLIDKNELIEVKEPTSRNISKIKGRMEEGLRQLQLQNSAYDINLKRLVLVSPVNLDSNSFRELFKRFFGNNKACKLVYLYSNNQITLIKQEDYIK